MLTNILVLAGQVAQVGTTLAMIAESFASGTGIDLGSEPPYGEAALPKSMPVPEAKLSAIMASVVPTCAT